MSLNVENNLGAPAKFADNLFDTRYGDSGVNEDGEVVLAVVDGALFVSKAGVLRVKSSGDEGWYSETFHYDPSIRVRVIVERVQP